MNRAWRRMKRNPFRDQRGTVWILTLILLLALMAVAGLAIDTMHAVAARPLNGNADTSKSITPM